MVRDGFGYNPLNFILHTNINFDNPFVYTSTRTNKRSSKDTPAVCHFGEAEGYDSVGPWIHARSLLHHSLGRRQRLL